MKRLAAAAVVLFSVQAMAYVIPARSVFKRFAAKQALEKIEEAPLTGRALVDVGGEEQRVQARMQVKFPGSCEVAVELPEGVARARRSGGELSVEGTPVPALEALAALGCPLATMKTVPASEAEKRLERIAKDLGVNTNVVSLRLLGDRPAWVVGAKPRDLASPQLWFDKATNRPVRVIAGHAGAIWDVRYEDVRSLATGRRHPRITEVWQGERRVLALRLMTQTEEAATEELDEKDEAANEPAE